jgi:dsDNA-specific endonuclease/ATPase MutS2
MTFKAGDKVGFLNETGSGVIIEIISPHNVLVEITGGIVIKMPLNELVTINDSQLKVVFPEHSKDYHNYGNKKTSPKRIRENLKEIDLHIQELMNLRNNKVLEVQLEMVKDEIEKAAINNISKIVFIHGVGTGKLRQSLRKLLKKYEGITFSDASYRKYGAGATEVVIFSKNKLKKSI